MIDHYTKLLEAVSETADAKAQETVVKKLIAHLVSTGRVKMLSQILRELYKIEARRKALAPVVEVAGEKEKTTAKRAAKELGIKDPEIRTNASLIKGFRIRNNDQLYDRSGKQGLVDIYQNVTN